MTVDILDENADDMTKKLTWYSQISLADDRSPGFLKRWGTGSRALSASLMERVVKKFGASLAFCRTSTLFRQRRRQRRNPLIFRLLRVCPDEN